ncbi:hypothetical protein F4553_002423 [Allocatelliglobosispora scoriae]|uniref:N-acetylglutamate synthase n=1 Tax=Allocatelliglobosispora scoriae TaxID=643052 RepID=A0A841BL77_9ACTN|nr:hypothetical protein [Allocatelliglobosispora scoriae]MBB5869044.1 hypothetical protein [Allocatelliglobosispora scoriae]
MPDISYHGRVFVPVVVAPAVQSTEETPRGRFSQQGDLVRGEYSGGWLRGGSMVGVCDRDGTVEGVYCLAFGNGDMVAGRCRYEPTVLADGRLRIAEHWERFDGSAGVSYIEEVTDDAGATAPSRRGEEH